MAQVYEQPDGSPFVTYAAPGHEKSRADSAEEALLDALLEGEQAYLFAECLRRQKTQTFERATIAITDRRLIVIGPAFPWGHTVKEAHPLTDCTVINGKERIDGSRLMVLGHDRGALCLYFPRSHRDDADAVLDAIGSQPAQEVEEPPQVQAQVPAGSVIDLQQFSRIMHSLDPSDQDDSD